MIMFSVPGDPKGKGRPRFSRVGKFTKVYTDKQTLTYEEKIKGLAKRIMGMDEPLKGPLTVLLHIRLPIPKSYPKSRTKACLEGLEMPCKKPDIDNIAKCFLDAMNDIVYVDDTQVVELNIKKVYAEVSGVDVTVLELK